MQNPLKHYSLRLTLRSPLLSLGQRRRRAFDLFFGELVRDDDVTCAAANVYAVRLGAGDVHYPRAAAQIGSEYLVRVCDEALTRDGHVQEEIADCFWHPVTDVYVLDGLTGAFEAAERPVLLGLFVQTMWAALSRESGILFLDVPAAELPFWRHLMGAEQLSGFVVAGGDELARNDSSRRASGFEDYAALAQLHGRSDAGRN
ncbi:hypothetical protein OV203_28460 [Nannocystis sp. ILAH1]|uniref:hypothetical protein n=1 Tax=Nannocystis sp. ILAH1 TaxID=2996789 RepID=UPI00226DF3AE|nr:hypothetical protein [Nannocystis sp. ILAH1]MCY0991111.1 hypothetical protein [Nannocystis sp. ILAH1]